LQWLYIIILINKSKIAKSAKKYLEGREKVFLKGKEKTFEKREREFLENRRRGVSVGLAFINKWLVV
jgi:hypothetical protein